MPTFARVFELILWQLSRHVACWVPLFRKKRTLFSDYPFKAFTGIKCQTRLRRGSWHQRLRKWCSQRKYAFCRIVIGTFPIFFVVFNSKQPCLEFINNAVRLVSLLIREPSVTRTWNLRMWSAPCMTSKSERRLTHHRSLAPLNIIVMRKIILMTTLKKLQTCKGGCLGLLINLRNNLAVCE